MASNQGYYTRSTKQCAICLEKIGRKPSVRTKCGHHFNAKCISEWLYQERKNSCPLCRTNLTLNFSKKTKLFDPPETYSQMNKSMLKMEGLEEYAFGKIPKLFEYFVRFRTKNKKDRFFNTIIKRLNSGGNLSNSYLSSVSQRILNSRVIKSPPKAKPRSSSSSRSRSRSRSRSGSRSRPSRSQSRSRSRSGPRPSRSRSGSRSGSRSRSSSRN